MGKEIDSDHAAFDDMKFCPALASLALTVNVHRLVLIAVEKHVQSEVFVELRHAWWDDAGAG